MEPRSIATPKRLRITGLSLAGLLAAWVCLSGLAQLFAENAWFQEVGYLPLFWQPFWTKTIVATLTITLSALFLLSNLAIADSQKLPPPLSPTPFLPLPQLLPLTFTLSLLLSLLCLHCGQVVAIGWKGAVPQLSWEAIWSSSIQLAKLPGLIPHLNSGLSLGLTWGLLPAIAIAMLIYPQVLLRATAVGLSLSFGCILSAHWGRILQGWYGVGFDRRDPLLGQDIGFYVFSLPVWELLDFWLLSLFLISLIAVALRYLLADSSLSQGQFRGFSRSQVRHLTVLTGCFMGAIGFSNWLSRYRLLYSTRGLVYGASYTNVKIELPAYTGLSLLAVAIGLLLFWRAATQRKFPERQLFPLFAKLLLVYLAVVTIGIGILPVIGQRVVVQPNELEREKPYIRHHIALTREAFDLENIDVKTFNPTNTLTAADLQKNDLTVRNIRLWDTRPLLEANRQLQQIRPYYKFLDADIDRYALPEKQQVLIAARELDYRAVPAEAQTWENEHLVYTHGYGFTLSPVNKVAPGGLPDYFVRDIGTGLAEGSLATGNLLTANDRIRASIPTTSPRIYYGEGTQTYVMTGTQVKELDYPSGSDNVYNTYDGTGGIAIDQFWRRGLLARYLNDWQMLFTRNFTSTTRLLFRRSIAQRVQTIAPFLRFDQDPYLVVADVRAEAGGQGGRRAGEQELNKATSNPSAQPLYPSASSPSLFWLIDAYTTSDRYPYSATGQLGGVDQPRVNYVRNSVKVVVDAYNGSVDFYIADSKDPVLRTWAVIFPTLFKPLSQMPAALRSHLRYPTDLFQVQSAQLMTYHMTDAQVFYNREDQWQIPREIYGSQPQPVEPYYLIMKLPTAATEEFVLLLPFTPNQRTNLTAWLASRSDGENYGKSLLYLFPKQQLVFGTEQIEARINQDPVISQQISLWNRQGSRAVQGNLLIIPIAQSLLYVEPLYLEAEQNSIPTLVRVIAAYENRIVMAETLEQALQAIFQSPKSTAPVVRPVQ